MKKWLYMIGVLTAVGILSRMPHPSQDIAKLEPVQVVYLSMDGGKLRIETDTGASGSGDDLTEATRDMKATAGGGIFLDTAEYLILTPEIQITPDFYDHLRPACKVCYTIAPPDLEAAADFLSVHSPKTTLAQIRALSWKGGAHGEA